MGRPRPARASRNALLADVVAATAYGRAYGFERAMDNLGAIIGPLLAIALVGLVGVRTAILLSIVPGLLAVAAILYAIAIHHIAKPAERERQPLRLRVRPVTARPPRPAACWCVGLRAREHRRRVRLACALRFA